MFVDGVNILRKIGYFLINILKVKSIDLLFILIVIYIIVKDKWEFNKIEKNFIIFVNKNFLILFIFVYVIISMYFKLDYDGFCYLNIFLLKIFDRFLYRNGVKFLVLYVRMCLLIWWEKVIFLLKKKLEFVLFE